MSDSRINRRDFVKTAVAAGAALSALSRSASVNARVIGANDQINVGVIGVGGFQSKKIDFGTGVLNVTCMP